MSLIFTHYRQLDQMDCGPTCLRMIAKHYGRSYAMPLLRERAEIGKDGVSLLGISQAAESIGFRSLAVRVPLARLIQDAPVPFVAHWGQNHFVVVYQFRKGQVRVADPASGLVAYTVAEFESRWASSVEDGERCGIALLLEPTPTFYAEPGEEAAQSLGMGRLLGYLRPHTRLIIQLFLGLLVGAGLQLLLPFLTQSVVDTGVQTRNLSFITLVLVAQLVLFVSRMAVEFIRSWILLHISVRLNLSILSDFLAKLMRLPLSYFDSKQTGDILQRIQDHARIEQFLTGTSLGVLFSVVNLAVFGVVLAWYNLPIFGVFAAGSVLYAGWVVLFLRARRRLDHKRFALASQNQSSLIQLVTGIQELKLNTCEHRKRWAWENLQVRQFRLTMRGLALGQYQQVGALFLNEGKNIVITFLAATAVVNGQLSLGAMLALQYIIGQLNSPVEQLVQFVQHYQDAQISMERLNEVHQQADEEGGGLLTAALPTDRGITLRNVSFTYPGAGNEPVLRNVNLTIPEGRVTAIVGSSGSGKTTLLKLLLRIYDPTGGDIRVGAASLLSISHRAWRERCGTVLQDGLLFSDTIANNIAVTDDKPNLNRLLHAVEMANIGSFIDGLPLRYNTKIGAEGSGVSQGQRQRLLIARAVYKDPTYLFLDEATNALDANNERVILNNLNQFFEGRTVLVVAHRLSTVRHADQIVVLEQGEVREVGTHDELTRQRGRYYELVKNQLELGV
jgi:ATP-binding cassette, subfamily B, bacterial